MKRIRNTLIIVVLLLVAGALLFITPQPDEPSSIETLPWQIRVLSNGQAEVFGLVIGKSNLLQVRQLVGEDIKISLFKSKRGYISAEAYVDRVVLNGLRAKMIFKLASDQSTLDEIYQRGLRVKSLRGGSHRVEVDANGFSRLAEMPIEGITYIPSVNLDEDLIEKRFGTAEFVKIENSQITHWLYPALGLDIVINAKGKEILQYVNPTDFGALRESLELKN